MDHNIYDDIAFSSDGGMMIYLRNHLGSSMISYLTVLDYDSASVLRERALARSLEVEVSDDGSRILAARGREILVFDFSSLELIYSDTVDNIGGGFLGDPDRFFYLKDDNDTLFIVDFSDPGNIIYSQVTFERQGVIYQPELAEVFESESQMVVFAGNVSAGNLIRVLNTGDFSTVNDLTTANYYNDITPHPGQAICYFSYKNYVNSTPNDRIDIYRIDNNTLSDFLDNSSSVLPVELEPRQLAITPDGEIMFILNGDYSLTRALGIAIKDKSLIYNIRPEEGDAEIIAINPKNFAQ
jgi:hypothetical protein